MNEFSRLHPRALFLQMGHHHEMAAPDVDHEVIAGRLDLVRLANFIVVQIADAFRDSSIRRRVEHLPPRGAGIEHAIVASHEKGLTVTDQLRTVARQCYAWSLPYGVSFADQIGVKDGEIFSESVRMRIEMLARDVRVYGELLARQRRADLKGQDSGFMARRREI